MSGGVFQAHRVVVAPCAPALLPAYRGLSDPLADLRAASAAAVAWLLADPSQSVLVLCPSTALTGLGPGGPRGVALAEHLLSAAGVRPCSVQVVSASDDAFPEVVAGKAVLALADGSARRGEKAPGYVDERALPYDAAIGAALRTGDLGTLGDLDVDLGAALLAEGAPVLRTLAARLAQEGSSVESAEVTYDDDPYGVQYWVARWQCGPA
jgi:hypothetical protein